MKLIILLIPILLLSSCTMDSTREQDGGNINSQNEIKASEIQIENLDSKNQQKENTEYKKDFGSGFILSQTDDETTLSYIGKVIKTWLYMNRESQPYLWEEDCENLQEVYESASKEDKNWRQIAWMGIPEVDRKSCIKKYLGNSIRTEKLDERFYEIIQTNYETATYWIYDMITGNIQEMPTMGVLKLSESSTGITIFIDMYYGDDNMNLFYNSDFSELIRKEEIPKQ